MNGKSAFDNSENFVLSHDQQVFAVDFHSVAAGVRTEYNLVTDFNGQRTYFTVFQSLAWACSDDHTVVGFFSSRTWQNDTASGFLFFFAATDNDAVVQRTKLAHCRSLLIVFFIGRCQYRQVVFRLCRSRLAKQDAEVCLVSPPETLR